MGWSGGTFSRVHDWTTDEGSAIDIEASRMDAEDDNFRDGINACLHKGGQNTPTADLPMGGNNHTGVGNATARDEYASAADVMDQDLIYYVDTGSANTYVITPSPAITAYEEGQRFVFRATNASTGASTLNVNAQGATAIQTADGSALTSGAIASGGLYECTYDANGTRFVLTSPDSITKVPDSRTITAGTGLSGGGDLTANRSLALSHLGLESLVDPNADRIAFWDDSAGAFAWLTVGTNLTLTDTTLTADTQVSSETKTKGAVTGRSSTVTLSDDPDLAGFTLAADTNYEFEGILHFYSPSTTNGGLRIAMEFSQTPQSTGVMVSEWTVGSTNHEVVQGISTTQFNFNDSALTAILCFRGMFVSNASTGGTMDLQWCQQALDTDASRLEEGSWMRVTPVE